MKSLEFQSVHYSVSRRKALKQKKGECAIEYNLYFRKLTLVPLWKVDWKRKRLEA